MSSKAKQKIIINNIPYGTGSIGMSDSTFKELPVNMKRNGTKLDTLSYLRACVQQGDFKGNFTIGNKSGYLFKYQDSNVLVDKDVRTILAAYKDQTESPIHICKPKIDKKSIKPLPIEKPQSNPDDIALTDHFIEQVRDRFYITDKSLAKKFIKDILLNGDYIGISRDKETEQERHMYSWKSVALYLSLDMKAAITIYEIDRIKKSPKEVIKRVLQQRINRLRKQEYKLTNTYQQIKEFEIDREIADVHVSLLRAKSESKKLACQARINALIQHKEEFNIARTNISKELRDHKKAMAMFT